MMKKRNVGLLAPMTQIIMYVCNALLLVLAILIFTVYPAYEALSNLSAAYDLALLDAATLILYAITWVLFIGDCMGVVGLIAVIVTLAVAGLYVYGIICRKFTRTDMIINGIMLGATGILLCFRPVMLGALFPDFTFPMPLQTLYVCVTEYLFCD